jgi:hypothetical protein
MKITKRQLKRIIKEEKARIMEYGGRPYDPTIPGDYERARDNPTGDVDPGASAALGKLADAVDQLISILGAQWTARELEATAETIRDME